MIANGFYIFCLEQFLWQGKCDVLIRLDRFRSSGRLLERMDSGQALERFMFNSNRTEAFLPTTAGPLPLPGGFAAVRDFYK